jgi:alkylation response protein AidB-like acyl-CoA dehydrogenase
MSTASKTERDALRALARDLAEHELAPSALKLDAQEPATLESCRSKLAEAGLMRALVAEDLGGGGVGAGELLIVLGELARGEAGCAFAVLIENVAGLLAAELGCPLQEAGYERLAIVPRVSEREVALREGTLYGRLEGALGALHAQRLALLVERPEGVGVWLLDSASEGLTTAADCSQMGLRAAPSAALELAGAPFAELVAPGEDGGGSPERALALLRLGVGAIARGIASRAYELARAYAQERWQGGVPIIEHEAVSDMLAAMSVRLRARRPPEALWREGAPGGRLPTFDPRAALAAKIALGEDAMATAIDAVQVFGGTGYMVETGVEKLMRDAQYCRLFPEPNWQSARSLVASDRAGA